MLYLHANQPHEAVITGTRLIEVAGRLRSARRADRISTLQQIAEAHDSDPTVGLPITLTNEQDLATLDDHDTATTAASRDASPQNP